jgi:hypothetical protein
MQNVTNKNILPRRLNSTLSSCKLIYPKTEQAMGKPKKEGGKAKVNPLSKS